MKKFLLPVACALCAVSLHAEDDATTPVTIASGFNVDVIAEDFMAETTDKATYPAMDGHHSCFIVNDGIMVSGGIPNDGLITTTNGHKYQFASFTSNNALYLAKGGDEGTLTFAEPVSAAQLGILGVGANIDDSHTRPTFTTEIQYTDGTSDIVENCLLPDWGDGNNTSYVYRCSQRFRADAGSNPENGTYRINEVLINADASKQIKSLHVTSTCPEGAWGWLMLNLFAVTTINNTSGIDSVAAESAEIEAIYNVAGIKLNELGNGLNIVKYTNGDIRKVYVNK